MWKTVKLGDVVSFEKVNGKDSGLPYVGMENISSETMQLVGDVEIPESTSSTFIFDDSHVLYGRLRPYLKKVLLPDFKGQCSTEIFCLKPNEALLRGYLAYWLLNPIVASTIEKTSTGARMPRANMNAILNFAVTLPPLAEQQRIVAKLDAAFAEIDRAVDVVKTKQKAIEHLTSAFKKDYLETEMSGDTTLLGESCKFFNGKAHEKDIDEKGQYVVVNSKFISSDGTVRKYTNEQMFPLSERDIVMVMSDVPNGKALAKTYLIEEDGKYSLNQRICCIRSTNYDAEYLKTIIDRNPHFLKRDNGENQTNLRKADILSCPLPVVTEETQRERKNYHFSLVEDLKSMLVLEQRIIDEYDKLKSAILAQELQPPQSEAA